MKFICYRMHYLPHIIIGDFDSLKPEIKHYYEQKGVKTVYNKDQDTTDLEKCVYYVFENSENQTKYKKKDSPKNILMRDNYSYSKVIVLGAFGGRID